MRSTRTRARDADRTAVCAQLDAAYVEGQLAEDEHRERVAAAMTARTLGELAALVEDLQVTGAKTPVARAPRRSRPWLWAAGAVLIAAALGIWLTLPGPAGPVAGNAQRGVSPLVVTPVQLHTPDGFRAFVAAMRDEFGTTTVASAVVYPEYASVDVPERDNPKRVRSYTYRGGFSASSGAGSRPAGDLIDLADVDAEKVLALLAGAGESLHVEQVTTRYLVMGWSSGAPILVQASNAFKESGHLAVRTDGTVVAVYPYHT